MGLKFQSFTKTTRFKTTLWYSSIFLLLEIIFGVFSYYYLYQSLSERLDSSLSRQAAAISNYVSDEKLDFDTFTPDSRFPTEEDLVWDIIYDAVAFNSRNTFIQISFKNKIIFKSGNLVKFKIEVPDTVKSKTILFDYKNEKLSPHRIRCAYMNKRNYKTIVAYPTETISETLKSLSDIYMILTPLFFIIAILGGALISAKSLSRIDSIIRRTEEISATNLNDKIEGEEYEDEYGRLVRKMNDMVDRIRTSIEYMNQFSIAASHELKTPLTILRGEIEVGLKSPKTAEQYKEILLSNYEEVLRLTNIIEKLFFISKIDHSLIRLNLEKVDLVEYLCDLVQAAHVFGKEKNINTVFENEVDNVYVKIDPETMKLAINNLIENAVKYGEANQNIVVKAAMKDENTVGISVINRGEGIAEDQLVKIFDRFYRMESSRNRNTGGIGLGLSLVKGIVKLHYGDIIVKSIPGQSTEFTIYLPAIV
jgi:signal transduction histidine kinase